MFMLLINLLEYYHLNCVNMDACIVSDNDNIEITVNIVYNKLMSFTPVSFMLGEIIAYLCA